MSNFKIGDYVWAKVPSYPWWPGEIFDVNDSTVTKLVKESRPSQDSILVRFVNPHQDDFYWYSKNDKNLNPFNEETCSKYENQKEVSKDSDLQWSIKQVKTQLGMKLGSRVPKTTLNSDSKPSPAQQKRRRGSDVSNDHPKKRRRNEDSDQEELTYSDKEELKQESASKDTKAEVNSKPKVPSITTRKLITTQAPQIISPSVTKPQEKEQISDSALKKLYDRLQDAVEDINESQIIQILRTIDEKYIIEVSQLVKIKIGKEIIKLQKSSNPQIKRLASVITARFKSIISRLSKGNEKSNTLNVVSKSSPVPVKDESSSTSRTQNIEKEVDIKKDDEISQEEKDRIENDVKEIVAMKRLDKLRTYFINLLACVLTKDLSKIEEMVDLATRIEDQVHNVYMRLDNNKIRYQSQLQSIHFNLGDPKNPDFIKNIVSGKITPEALATMKSYDMASKEFQEIRAEIRKEEIRMSTVAKGESRGGGMFTCSKCRSDKVHTVEVQTRSADEPMTVFASCMNCGRRWRM